MGSDGVGKKIKNELGFTLLLGFSFTFMYFCFYFLELNTSCILSSFLNS